MSKTNPQVSIIPHAKSKSCIPLASSLIQAGFPTVVEGESEKRLDISDYLIKHPNSTFFVKVEGDSMIGAQITSGDLLVVDRALTAKNKSIIVARINQEFTVKRLLFRDRQAFLKPENSKYPLIAITEEVDFEVWGVVTYVIHSVR